MNYIKLYVKLIRKTQSREEPMIYEKHHVFPKSIYGKNNYIAKLTPREHYIAHALLYRGFKQRYGDHNPKTQKMFFAFWAMHCKGPRHNRTYINSRLYETLKIEFRERMRVCNSGSNNPFFGKKHNIFTRRKLSLMNGGSGQVEGLFEYFEEKFKNILDREYSNEWRSSRSFYELDLTISRLKAINTL